MSYTFSTIFNLNGLKGDLKTQNGVIRFTKENMIISQEQLEIKVNYNRKKNTDKSCIWDLKLQVIPEYHV